MIRNNLQEGINSKDVVLNKTTIKFSEEEYLNYSGYYVLDRENQVFQVLKNNNTFGAQGDGYFIPFNFTSKKGDFFIKGFGEEIDGKYKIIFDSIKNKPKYIVNLMQRPILFFNGKHNKVEGPNKKEWDNIVGEYSIKMYNIDVSMHDISIKNGYLLYDQMRLMEIEPNLFSVVNGEVLDFRNSPMYRNIRLFKIK